MSESITLNPGDLQAGCAFFCLERQPELYLQASQAVYRDLKLGDTSAWRRSPSTGMGG